MLTKSVKMFELVIEGHMEEVEDDKTVLSPFDCKCLNICW